MYKTNLNELYTEEGFDVLDFNTFSLLEKHGVLSGENSCSKFASHLLDFIEELDKKGIKFGEFIVHSNENCPNHQEYINKGVTDLSTDGWDLPAWASWELVIHIGVLEDNGTEYGKIIILGNGLEAHIGLKSPQKMMNDKNRRKEYSTTIQHEMKHYFDYVMEFNKKGKIYQKEYKELNKLQKMDKKILSDDEYVLIGFFYYFFYRTSEGEMSAWLENSRYNGYRDRAYMDRHHDDYDRDNMYKRLATGVETITYSTYKKLLESILLWKEDKSQYDKIDKICHIHYGGIKTYDEFKKLMMKTFGSYLESRFGKKESFEKYIKRYIKILDKYIKKHSKIWADGYNGIDLDETPEDIEKMLIKKREERLERIRKKKEGE